MWVDPLKPTATMLPYTAGALLRPDGARPAGWGMLVSQENHNTHGKHGLGTHHVVVMLGVPPTCGDIFSVDRHKKVQGTEHCIVVGGDSHVLRH